MGLLFDAVRREYENIIKFKELEKTNFLESRKFDNYYKAMMSQVRINKYLSMINEKAKYFYSLHNLDYNGTMKQFDNIIGDLKNGFPVFDIKADQIYDFKPILDQIEADIKPIEVKTIVEDDEVNEYKIVEPEKHLLNDMTMSIRMSLSSLNIKDSEISREDRVNIPTLLNYVNDLIVAKADTDVMDKVIENVSEGTGIEAKNHVEEFANKNGYDPDELKKANGGMAMLDFYPANNKQGDLLKDISNQGLNLSNEYKSKILELDRLITEKNIIQNANGGESDHKEYGFTDWINKATEVKDAVVKINSIKSSQRVEKIQAIKEFIEKTKEFQEINQKYVDLYEEIENKFDIKKISLPGNIYSGRAHPYNDIKSFKPDIPKNFDNERAPYGVIINGYAQLKAFCNNNNIALKDLLDNPTKEYRKAGYEFVKNIDQKYVLPRENNTLGKRMAHILVQIDGEYNKKIGEFSYSSRALEFLWQTQEQNENSIDTYIKGSATVGSIHLFNHNADRMFNKEDDEADYDTLKSLFARGDEVDNLFTLSKNYRDENLELAKDLDVKYNEAVTAKAHNASAECNRVLKTINDFLTERKNLDEHEEEITGGNAVLKTDAVSPAKIFAAGREYFKDYLVKNNINVLDIADKSSRNKVLDFINDPVKAFQKKYGNDNKFFLDRQDKTESYATFKRELKTELNKMYEKEDTKNFIANFAQNNQKENGYNTGKSINTILSDNKGGFFERYIFRNTSKEYKALESAMKAATDPESPTNGDYTQAKEYALKYLEHKLPDGVNEANISTTGKKRIEFCRSVLRTLGALPPKYEEPKLINEEVEKQNVLVNENVMDKKVEVAVDNDDFQKNLNNNLDPAVKNNNNEIIQNENEKDDIEISNE